VDDASESHTWISNMQLLKMNNKLLVLSSTLPCREQKRKCDCCLYDSCNTLPV